MASSNFTIDELNDPFSAKSNKDFSKFSIIFCPSLFRSLSLAVSIILSEILINSLFTYKSKINFDYSKACLEDVENLVILTKYSGMFSSSFSFSK